MDEFDKMGESLKLQNIDKLRDYDKKEYKRACIIIDDFLKKYGKPETWKREQVEAMKFQYAIVFKTLAEEGSYILKNFWLNCANMDSHIDKCSH